MADFGAALPMWINSLHGVFRFVRIIMAATTLCIAGGSLAGEDTETNESQIHLETSVSAVGNLFYQLECLGNRIRCSQSAFEELWNDLGPLDETDTLSIRKFASTLDVYGFRAQLGPRSTQSEVSYDRFGDEVVDIGPPPTQSFSLLNRIRLASYAAVTTDDLTERLGLFMHPEDVAALNGTISRFWPRFKGWWESEAVAPITEFNDALIATLERQNQTTFPAVSSLFGLNSNEYRIALTVHLIAHPLELSSTNAEVVENQAIVEVLANESPATRVGVIVHELVHYLFAISPRAIHELRLEGALRSEDQRAAAALGLMNEAIATAIGNGYVEEQYRGDSFEEYFERENSFYARQEVDTAAKSIYPLVREYLSAQKTIDVSFVDQYFSLVTDSVGGDLDTLSARLRVSAYIAADEPLAQAMRNVPRILGMNSLYGSTLESGETVVDSVLHRHTYLNGVVLLRERNRPTVGNMLPEASTMVSIIRSGDADSCVFTRPSGSSVYFVVIDESETDAERLVETMRNAELCE